MGTKSLLRIILAMAIIAAYFLPWFQYAGSSESAFDIVTQPVANEGQRTGQLTWYASVLIPLFALICLVQSLTGRTPSGFTRTIPFIVAVIFLALTYIGLSSTENSDITPGDIIALFGIGVYVTLIASFLLLFMGRDTVAAPVSPAV